MVKYEVNISINKIHFESYLAWLKPHIKEMLMLKGFIRADLFLQQVEHEEDLKKITVDYYLSDMDAYRDYLKQNAKTMQAQAAPFQGLFSIERRLFTLLEQF